MSLHPSVLVVGELYWESGQYGNAQFRVLTKPEKTSDTLWEWDAKMLETGEVQHYAWDERFHKPGIYDEPAYVSVEWLRGETDDCSN